jgi:hypothetical protein
MGIPIDQTLDEAIYRQSRNMWQPIIDTQDWLWLMRRRLPRKTIRSTYTNPNPRSEAREALSPFGTNHSSDLP